METRYPHLISQGTRRNHQWPIVVSDRPVEADTPHVFVGPGLLAPSGSLTPRGRTRIDDAIAKLAAQAKARYCVVWGPHDCTYYHADGTCRPGRQPPHGDPEIDPALLARTPLALEDCWYVELPAGCDETHICIVRQGDFVEITPGEPILVADFNTPWPDADPPLAKFRDEDGRWKLPFTLRGVTVTHADGDVLYGPIQPRNGPERIILRSPWPQDVADAFDQLAGVKLPDSIHQAAWRAVDPMAYDMAHVGVLRAA